MSIFEIHAVEKKEPKIVKTSIVGYCYGCQSIHFKEETFREDGVRYCKGTGRLINTEAYERPDPVEAKESDFYEWAFEGAGQGSGEPSVLPTRAEMITMHMEALAELFDIDTVKYQVRWDELVEKVIELT